MNWASLQSSLRKGGGGAKEANEPTAKRKGGGGGKDKQPKQRSPDESGNKHHHAAHPAKSQRMDERSQQEQKRVKKPKRESDSLSEAPPALESCLEVGALDVRALTSSDVPIQAAAPSSVASSSTPALEAARLRAVR